MIMNDSDMFSLPGSSIYLYIVNVWIGKLLPLISHFYLSRCAEI